MRILLGNKKRINGELSLYIFLETNKRTTFKRFKLKKVIQIRKLSKVFRIYYITKVHTSSFNLDDLVRNSKVCQGKPLRC